LCINFVGLVKTKLVKGEIIEQHTIVAGGGDQAGTSPGKGLSKKEKYGEEAGQTDPRGVWEKRGM